MSAKVQSILPGGTGGTIIDIECHLSNNLPTIVIVGFANKAVGEARERIRGAFATSRIMLPRKRITVNLAPADIPKADSGFDLAIAVAILIASQQVPETSVTQGQAVIGELGLDGSTRAVRGIIGKLLAGRAKDITTFYIPSANLIQAQLVPGISLVPVDSLQQLYNHLTGTLPIKHVLTGHGKYKPPALSPITYGVQLSEIVGQARAKRALIIAAAGGHNILYNGPPGTGKSMLAKALPSLMPLLDREEILEVTQLHSLASHDYERIVTTRPLRAPHHSASMAAITGGGLHIRPGEISLAHRGILFFDELPEFSPDILEALRQPLEDKTINVARAQESVEYPANFMLIATANPCPCGYKGVEGGGCECPAYAWIRYRQRLSGPILDRIDLHSYVGAVKHDQLLTTQANPAADRLARQLVQRARHRQAERYGSPSKLNADMTNADIKQFCKLTHTAIHYLNEAAPGLQLSARAYMRVIKVARTIADLNNSNRITWDYVSQALDYRARKEDPK